MTDEQRQKKQRALDLLRQRLPRHADTLRATDPRLLGYFTQLASPADAENDADPADPQPVANLYELLGAVRFLRLMDTYDFDQRKVRKVIFLREGKWEQKADGTWRHVSGGIAQPGTSGPMVYRWEPFQLFILASVFGFRAWIDTELTTADRTELLPTEKIVTTDE